MSSLILLFALYVFLSRTFDARCQAQGCGGSYTYPYGSITSPNYPNNYNSSLNCYYYIDVPSLYYINITLLDFATESCCDWLQVNCTVNRFRPVGLLSQKFQGLNVNLSSQLSFQSCCQISLYFRTDSSVAYKGFYLIYLIYRAGTSIPGGISTAPMNSYILNENSKDITLTCTSSSGYYPWWSYSSNGYSFDIITDSTCQILSGVNTTAYNTKPVYGSYACQLVIKSAVSYVPGVYRCTDLSLSPVNAFVVYTNATTWVGNNQACPNTDVVRGEQVKISCAVFSSSSSFTTQLQAFHYLSFESQRLSDDTSSNQLSIIVTVPPERLPSYTCNIYFKYSGSFPSGFATNLPQNLSVRTNTLHSSYPPEEDSITINGAVNGNINRNGLLVCYVSAFPGVNYSWTDVGLGLTVNSPAIAVSHDGTYTCTATNFIRGTTNSVSKSIGVTVKDVSAITTLIVGVVLGAVVLIQFVIIIIILTMHFRKKKTSQDETTIDRPEAGVRHVDVNQPNEDTTRHQRYLAHPAADTVYDNRVDTTAEVPAYEILPNRPTRNIQLYEKLNKKTVLNKADLRETAN